MSFDVNFSMNEPIIKATTGSNNDGGSAGNTGYMGGGGGRKKDQNQGSLFSQNGNKGDSFELSSKKLDYMNEPEGKKDSWFNGLLSKIKKEL